MRPLFVFALALGLVLAVCPASARTARDLSARMRIDGYSAEFIAGDEDVFGLDSIRQVPQEPRDDSKWGANNEIHQIHLTWDAQFLYAAVDGKIWGNNMVLFFDSVPNRGMTSMEALNSWRRNVGFDTFGRFPGDEYLPDVFGATWDTNTEPRLITHISGNQVDDHRAGPEYRAAATFDQGNDGRSMEMAIPWRNVFAGLGGGGTRDTLVTVGGVTDTLRRMPLGVHSIKVGALLTGGGDGTGGPDSAPDNLRGHTDDSNAPVVLDNYALVELDLNDDSGLGAGGPDGIPDWNVSPKQRVTFRYPPPIVPLRFSIRELTLDRPAFKPDRGEGVTFHIEIGPPLDPDEPIDVARRVRFSANLFDATGRKVRDLLVDYSVQAINADSELQATGLTRWDGRDSGGKFVDPGIYVLRLAIEPNLDRATRALVVVR